ncbi:MAG: hypothetical protein RRX92_08255 [Lachnospiraceae bacterium]
MAFLRNAVMGNLLVIFHPSFSLFSFLHNCRIKQELYASNHHIPLFDAMQTTSRKAFKRVFGY